MQSSIINSTHQSFVRRGVRSVVGGAMAALLAMAAVPGVVSAADAPEGRQVKAPNQAPQAEAKAVGACNTVKGCKALKAACDNIGYDFKPGQTSGTGICKEKTQKSPNPPSLAVVGANDASCHSVAMCKALKATCQGTYKRVNSHNGHCYDE